MWTTFNWLMRGAILALILGFFSGKTHAAENVYYLAQVDFAKASNTYYVTVQANPFSRLLRFPLAEEFGNNQEQISKLTKLARHSKEFIVPVVLGFKKNESGSRVERVDVVPEFGFPKGVTVPFERRIHRIILNESSAMVWTCPNGACASTFLPDDLIQGLGHELCKKADFVQELVYYFQDLKQDQNGLYIKLKKNPLTEEVAIFRLNGEWTTKKTYTSLKQLGVLSKDVLVPVSLGIEALDGVAKVMSVSLRSEFINPKNQIGSIFFISDLGAVDARGANATGLLTRLKEVLPNLCGVYAAGQ